MCKVRSGWIIPLTLVQSNPNIEIPSILYFSNTWKKVICKKGKKDKDMLHIKGKQRRMVQLVID